MKLFCSKWFVQFTKCVHWFNPIVYLIGRRIDQSCELSCDETVIKRLDEAGREDYGDALIASLKSQEHYSAFVVSMTMSDNKKKLKERLDMLMNYKKKTVLVKGVTSLLTGLMLCGFALTGAFATNNTTEPPRSAVLSLGSDWERYLTEYPHTGEFSELKPTSPFQVGAYELKAGEEYSFTLNWQNGGSTLPISIIEERGSETEVTLENGVTKKIKVPEDGLYTFYSYLGRSGGTMTNLKYSFQKTGEDAPKNEETISSGDNVQALDAAYSVSGDSPLDITYTGLEYDNDAYRWPYRVINIKNTSGKTISSYQIASLAYDKEGNPLELYWDASNVAANGDVGSVGFTYEGSTYIDFGIVTDISPNSPKSYLYITSSSLVPEWMHEERKEADEAMARSNLENEIAQMYADFNREKPSMSAERLAERKAWIEEREKERTNYWLNEWLEGQKQSIESHQALAPGEEMKHSSNLFDGWNQSAGTHKAAYIISIVKQVTLEDGSAWNNPEYANWISTYEGKNLTL